MLTILLEAGLMSRYAIVITTLLATLSRTYADTPSEGSAREERFYNVYHLKKNEVLKRIAPPLIPERAHYYCGSFFVDVIPDLRIPNSFIFHQDPSLKRWGSSMAKSWRVDGVLRSIIGLASYEFSGRQDLLDTKLSGDWIVRPKATIEEKLKALEYIVSEVSGKCLRFEKRKVKGEALVAFGIYQYQPLPNMEKDWLHLFSDTPSEGGGGGTAQSFHELLWELGDLVNIPVVNESLSSNYKPITFRRHTSANLRNVHGPQKSMQLDLLLKNFTLQTSIAFMRRIIEREIWFLTEEIKQ